MILAELSAGALLVLALAIFWAVLYGIVLAHASHRRSMENAEVGTLAQIRDAMVAYLAGNKDQTRLAEFARRNRPTVGNVIMEFQGTVAGSARDQLCDLALELGLVHDWCQELRSKGSTARRTACNRLSFVCAYEPCQRLAGDLLLECVDDADRGVRLPAARALAQSGDLTALGHVFHLAITDNMLIRILLSEDLRPHAPELCQEAIPQALHAEEPELILAALEMLTAWERALMLADLHELLDSRNRDIRMSALRLAPFVNLTQENRAGVLQALGDDDTEVSTVAALAAGRMKLQAALPSLARLVRTGTAEVARIAAQALAEMPPKGWQTLEEFADGANPSSAFIAGEALERARRRAGV
jgi:hypothetical protein